MKRPMKAGIWIASVFAFLTSGLIASIAWFESGRNQIDMNITGSVVEEYFHCGSGTAQDPFVITRPVHFYHLVEFFQRETILPADDLMVEFGADYLYFQVGYDLDNDGDLEVYDYDDLGVYRGTTETASYSTVLNMAYYSGGNALMPIGTNEVPFIGSFDGKASEGISIANIGIHCAERVKNHAGQTVDRAASDIGVFGFVADQDNSAHQTIIKNAVFDGLTIDLSDVTATVAPSITSISHPNTHYNVAHVGLIAGHVHAYNNYDADGPTNATPLSNVYVSNATVQGGSAVHCDYGYIGKIDSSGGQTPAIVSNEVTVLVGGGGQGDNFGEGGSISASDYLKWLYNGPRDNGAALEQGNSSRENHITRSNQYEAHYTVSSILSGDTDFLFMATNGANTKTFFFYNDERGYFDDGTKHPFSWRRHTGGIVPTGSTNYWLTFDSNIQFGSYSGTEFRLDHYQPTGTINTRVYTTDGTLADASSTYGLDSSIVYRMKDNANNTSGNIHKTYFPLKFSDANRSGVSDDNTGYIVGTSLVASNGGASANGSPKMASYGLNYISNSVGSAAYSNSDIILKAQGNAVYDDKQMEILTFSTKDDDWVAIKDSHNNAYYGSATTPKNANISSKVELLRTPEQLGFKKYEAYASDPSIIESAERPLTRNALRNFMTYQDEHEVTRSYQRISGIHFDTVTANNTKYGVVANNSNYKITVPRAHLKGVSAANSANYELLKGAINFFFPSQGYVNFLAGTYYSSTSVVCNFFSLYNVKRSAAHPNQIDSIQEIVGVYKKKGAAKDDPYIYKVYNVASTGGTTGQAYFLDSDLTEGDLDLVFDVDAALRCGTAHQAPVHNALYYFEVPINPGEYAMGVVSNSTNSGAYMLYLDIGANADLSPNQINGIKDVPLFTQIDFQTDSFVTNSCFNVGYIIPNGATKSTFSITISCHAVTHEGHSYTCYELSIINTTGNNFSIACLLMDDDADNTNDYYYMYGLTYNGGTRTEHFTSDAFTGVSGETTMTGIAT